MDPDLAVENAALPRLEAINEAIRKGNSDIQKYYEGAVVLLTGGTGFVGKHVLEKLFRSCKLKKVYLLVRQIKDKTSRQRLADILDDMIFEDLYKEKPNFVNNIDIVNGDISKLGLGLSPTDRQKLTSEVDIVIHVAAVVRFNTPLKMATIINVRGAREMLCLAKECTKLRSYVHVSTAYSHATYSRNEKDVLEAFYPCPMPPNELIELAETADEAVIDSVTAGLMKDWPNTYTFTKAVAEELLRTTADGLPVCVVRPATVLNAYTEPRPGWIDKTAISGHSGLCHGIKMGLIHLIYGSSKIMIDFIPVDFVTNTIVAAGWETAQRRAAGLKDIKIYTVCSNRHRLTWGEASAKLYENRNGVSPQAMWYSAAINVNNKYLYITLHWLLHLIPAYILDFVSILFRRRPRFVKLYTKMEKLSEVMKFFTTHEWLFSDANTLALYEKLSPVDQAIFPFDSLRIDWYEMMRLWPVGLRRFFLKDGLKGTKLARKKQFWFRIASYFFLSVYVYIFWIVLRVLFWFFHSFIHCIFWIVLRVQFWFFSSLY